VEEIVCYYESIKLGFCWLKPIGYIVEGRIAESSNGISSKALNRKVHGGPYECHIFFYPFRCDNSVIENRRMEELEIKKDVLISVESILGQQRSAMCRLCWLSW
jgi:hypothetical protein